MKNSRISVWPVVGYEDAPQRKRLAYFRPWIEDRTVCLVPGELPAAAYVGHLASEVVESGPCDLVFAPGVPLAELERAAAEARERGIPFVGWSADDATFPESETFRQAEVWPFTISSCGEDPGKPMWVIPAGAPQLVHLSIGVAIPTHAHPNAAVEAVATLAAEYPGRLRFALVANGVTEVGVGVLRAAAEDHPDLIQVIEFAENRGYGRGCNAGLEWLLRDASLDLIGVGNDDVLPGTDCLYELARAMTELEALGHRPGAIGPVSNEINGSQRVDFVPIQDIFHMRKAAGEFWGENRSSAGQTLQLRGLLLLWTRDCLKAVGGFDPRFGLGNFEDDDHNLRTRLAGFTLWVAGGSFLFHHGSSTFRTLKIDYEANIRRNSELMIRKWGIDRLEDWIALESAPKGVELFQAFDTRPFDTSHVLRINGEEVDLVHQASDVEFAAWIMHQAAVKSPEGRRHLIELLAKDPVAA